MKATWTSCVLTAAALLAGGTCNSLAADSAASNAGSSTSRNSEGEHPAMGITPAAVATRARISRAVVYEVMVTLCE